MRLPGYCSECRRFRSAVNISSSGMAVLARGGTPMGICHDCEEDESTAPSLRNPAGQRCACRTNNPTNPTNHNHQVRRNGRCTCDCHPQRTRR